jgi:hypothetical protein
MKYLRWHIQQFKVVRVSTVLFTLVGWDEGGGATNPCTMFCIISVSGDSPPSGYLEVEGKHAGIERGLERSGVFANDCTAVLKDSVNKAI